MAYCGFWNVPCCSFTKIGRYLRTSIICTGSCFVFGVDALPCRADEWEVATITAKGGDVAGEMRRLEDTLGRLCDSFQEAKRLAAGSQEAAAKCQVRFAHVFAVVEYIAEFQFDVCRLLL